MKSKPEKLKIKKPPKLVIRETKRIFDSTEDLMSKTPGFGLEKTMTPLQKAICRIVDGKPLGILAEHDVVKEALGVEEIPDFIKEPKSVPREVDVLAGVRTGKSQIAACRAVVASQTCDLSLLGPGDIPRYSVCSLRKDNAKQVIAHLSGLLMQEKIRDLIVDMEDESNSWVDIIKKSGDTGRGSFYLWHPSGRPVQVKVIAGARAGGSLVSRWNAGGVFDEFAKMLGADSAVINYNDGRSALMARLLPGAQMLSVSSPWQPYGPAYDRYRARFGDPKPFHIVIKAKGPNLNPVWWSEERCEALKNNPLNAQLYITDVLAEFAEGQASLFPQKVLHKAAQTKDWIPYEPGHDYSCSMDPATRNNSWTLVIADRYMGKKRIVAWKEWIGTSLNPLSPRAVMTEVAEMMRMYGQSLVITDQWSADAIKDIGYEFGISVIEETWQGTERADAYIGLAVQMADGRVIIPDDEMFLKDFTLVDRKATPNGVAIHLQHSPDGRHCDYAAASARVFARWFEEEKYVVPGEDDPEYSLYKENRDILNEVAKYRKEKLYSEDIEHLNPYETEEDRKIFEQMIRVLRDGQEQYVPDEMYIEESL